MKSKIKLFSIIVLMLTVYTSANAATKYWKSQTVGGQWTNVANWSDVAVGGTAATAVPVAGDDIVITPSGTFTTNITNVPTITLNSITINGTGSVNIQTNGAAITIAAAGSLNIASGNTLTIVASAGLTPLRILGTAGNFTTSGEGSFITGAVTNPLPAGTVSSPVTYTFDVTFTGSTTSTVTPGVTTPAYAIYNRGLTINMVQPAKGARLGGNTTVNGTLTLTAGLLDCAANTLTLANPVISGGSNASYINMSNVAGALMLKGVGATATVLPIGTATSYAPLTLTNTTGVPDITANLKSTITNVVSDATKVVNLEWSVLSSAATTTDITYQFNTADFGSAYSAAASELGDYTTSYAVSPLGTPTGSNPYTVTATGLSIPTSGSNLYVIGNTLAILGSSTTLTANEVSKALVNVVNGEVVISGAEGKTIEIYNSLGKRICSTVANQNSSRISVNGKGIYLVKIANQTSKIIL